jgi:hypothetical protein
MPKKVTPKQWDAVLRMLAQGQDRDRIAAAVEFAAAGDAHGELVRVGVG